MTKRAFVVWCCALSVCAFALASCGDLELRSVPGDVSPTVALSGLWQGEWQSDDLATTGAVTIRIQDFAGVPVVNVATDNPCLLPRDYELLVQGTAISLRDQGVPVLEASLGAVDMLAGSYGCEQDAGSWQATRVAALPELLDLSGVWEGNLLVVGQPPQPMTLRLVQRVTFGQLTLQGAIELPGLLTMPLAVGGLVRFGSDDFELRLDTRAGVQPILTLAGVGSVDPLELTTAGVQVVSSGLPFSQALVNLRPQ